MPAIIEYASTNLKKDYDQAALREGLAKLRKIPGVQALYPAVAIEDPQRLEVYTEWDDYEAHQAFTDSPEWKPIVTGFAELSDPDAARLSEMCHFNLPQTLTELASAEKPILERIIFTTTASEEEVKQAMDAIAPVFTGPWTWAVSKENSKRVLLLVTWASVEAHQEHTKTEIFKEHVPKLRKVMTSDVSVLHFKLEKFE